MDDSSNHRKVLAETSKEDVLRDLQEMYAPDEGKDVEKMFRLLITEKNFSMTFFESSITFVCEHADVFDTRSSEAVQFLKKIFFRVFLSITKSGKCIRPETSESCRAKLTQLIRKLPHISDAQRLSLQMLQSGLFSLAQSTLVTNPEVMTGLEAAYDMLTNRRPDLSRGLPLTHTFFTRSDFLTSLAVELVLSMCQHNEFSHLSYILAVLNAAVKSRDRFADYLLEEIVRYLKMAPGWVPDYLIFFEGEGSLQGLSGLRESQTSPEFSAHCRAALLELAKSEVPELKEVADKALGEDPEAREITQTSSSNDKP